MPNRHKTRLLGWHPSSAEQAERVREEAERRGVDLKVVLDEMLGMYVTALEGGNHTQQVATTAPAPVSPPEPPRAAVKPQGVPRRHALNCKCGICQQTSK